MRRLEAQGLQPLGFEMNTRDCDRRMIMNLCNCPSGMTRRHFLSHLAGAAAMASPAIAFTNSILAKSLDLKKQHKSCILLWMGGGPSTIDIWDLKPGAADRRISSSRFRPTSTVCRSPNTCRCWPSKWINWRWFAR